MDEEFHPRLPTTEDRYSLAVDSHYPYNWAIFQGRRQVTQWSPLSKVTDDPQGVSAVVRLSDNIEYLFPIVKMLELASGVDTLTIYLFEKRNGRLGYVLNNLHILGTTGLYG